jgi:uncharacterized protein
MIEKLFTSKNRVKLLAFLLIDKNHGGIREISREIKMPVSVVKKEVDVLTSLGIAVKRRGYFSENDECSFVEDLRNILLKTDYLYVPLKDALDKKNIKFALIFGSFASGSFESSSDIDLLIIGEIKLSEVYKLLKPVEKQLKTEINPVVWTVDNLKKERKSGFVRDIFKKENIMLKGSENEIRQIVE